MSSSAASTSHTRIGFIGLGAMGTRMALRLLDAGYVVSVYNRTRHRADEPERAGASVARSPRALAASSDLVLSSVADDQALAEVMFGSDGALAGAPRGSVIIDLSTVHPHSSLRLSAAGLTSGIQVLDAPVSGSIAQVEHGQLVIFVGGPPLVYERCWPVLQVLGKACFYMGPSGSGAMTKLCVNALLGMGMQALAEALALGESAGIARPRLLEALAGTAVLSPSQRSKFDNIQHDEYPATFPLRLMFKDFGLILRRALELSVAMPATAAAAQVAATEHAREMRADLDEDLSAVVRTMSLAANR